MARKVLLVLALAVVALLLVAHAMLTRWLTAEIHGRVVPRIERELHVPVAVSDAGVGLWGGRLRLRGVRLGNPDGFSQPDLLTAHSISVDVGLFDLFRHRINRIEQIRCKDLTLTIVRNGDGRVNIRDVAASARGRPASAPAPAAASGETAPPTSETDLRAPRQTVIDSLGADLRVSYTDEKAEEPYTLVMDLRLDARNLANFEDAARPWGALRVTGHLASDPTRLVADLRGSIAPLVDPEHPSFDLMGSVSAVDLSAFPEIGRRNGISCDPFTLGLSLACSNGVFDASRSVLTLYLRNVRFEGKTAKRLGGLRSIPTLTVPIPVGGPVRDPQLRWEEGLLQAILQSASSGWGALLGRIAGGTNDAAGRRLKEELERPRPDELEPPGSDEVDPPEPAAAAQPEPDGAAQPQPDGGIAVEAE